MRSMKINRGWHFGLGMMDLGKRMRGEYGESVPVGPAGRQVRQKLAHRRYSGAHVLTCPFRENAPDASGGA